MLVIIEGVIPSKKNGKRIAKFGEKRFIVSSKSHEDWHEPAGRQLFPYKMRLMNEFGSLPIKKVKINFLLYTKNNQRQDLSNKWESVADLLVDCGILEDDCVQVIPRVNMQWMGIDGKRPRAEIEIEKI